MIRVHFFLLVCVFVVLLGVTEQRDKLGGIAIKDTPAHQQTTLETQEYHLPFWIAFHEHVFKQNNGVVGHAHFRLGYHGPGPGNIPRKTHIEQRLRKTKINNDKNSAGGMDLPTIMDLVNL